MLYPSDIEQKIGFDKIRLLIKQNCLSELAKEEIDALSFSSNFDVIVAQLTLVDEMAKLMLDQEESLPLHSTADLREAFLKTRIEGTFLEVNDLVAIRQNALMVQSVTTFLLKRDDIRFGHLKQLATPVQNFPEVLKRIDTIVNKYGEIKDNASTELARIRRDIVKSQSSISRTLHTILRQAQAEGLVEKDTAPTMRDGRLVIPIPAMNKRRIGGIIHDESATGKTAFVEPSSVVELNNQLRELENEERREIIRILTDATNFLRPFYPNLLDSTLFLAKIDALQAKAKWSIQIKAIKPHLKNTPFVDWFEARHPLLQLSLEKQHKSIVPLSIKLTQEQRILLISGPNAGGKSVCLKTVGLLQYMLQCGLPIAIHERSQAGIFEHIFIDIGDEQSIENDLSTYSSHLLNMKHCIRHSNAKSLLLIDEFGTGTEPQIGGAIAEAVLEKFNTNKAYGVITTHYTNLKHFASNTEGIVNGAMLYDRHEMRPLFQLQIGNPGSSFAVEIARKIGIPEDIILSASQKVGSEHIDYDKNLQDAARDKRYWENKRQQIREKEKHIDGLVQKYEQEMSELKVKQKEILRAAKAEATELLNQTNAKIEQTIRIIKESEAAKEPTQQARAELNQLKTSLVEVKAKPTITQAADTIKIGDYVTIKGQTMTGQLIELNKDIAIVTFGNIKSTVPLNKLNRVSHNQLKQTQRASVGKSTTEAVRERQLNFKSEIDVRGMRVDEALQAVMYFVDDAQMLSIGKVRILHGTGTGALRQAIRDYLHGSSAVTAYRDEHVQFGGAGITVVELK